MIRPDFAGHRAHYTGGGVSRFSIGLDFGTESARAIVVDVGTGEVAGQAVVEYEHGGIDRALPFPGGRALPPDFALQEPLDWLNAARDTTREALKASGVPPQ